MWVAPAGDDDIQGLSHLLWLHDREEEPSRDALDSFRADLTGWWELHRESHAAFVARVDPAGLVGMAWVALLPRVPRPGVTTRLSADIQSVFVLPEHRGRGIGSALVEAAAGHAMRLGALRVTVHSGSRAVPVYERLGFTSSRQLLQRPGDEPISPPGPP